VKAIEKDFTHAPSLMRKRKLVRQIAKFVENNKQMERVEEEEKGLNVKVGHDFFICGQLVRTTQHKA
jgi:hypothetical protein